MFKTIVGLQGIATVETLPIFLSFFFFAQNLPIFPAKFFNTHLSQNFVSIIYPGLDMVLSHHYAGSATCAANKLVWEGVQVFNSNYFLDNDSS